MLKQLGKLFLTIIFLCTPLLPQAKNSGKHLALITRKTNNSARDFYKKLGFQETDYMHEGYSKERYIGLERDIQDDVILEWVSPEEFKQAKTVFVEAFLDAYNDFSQETLGLKTDKKTWLEETFDEELNDLTKNPDEIHAILAKDSTGSIVGLATFSKDATLDNQNAMYIRQLAVDPQHQKKGIGKKLTFSILSKLSVNHIALITRKVNQSRRNFYSKLGFKETDYMHEGYSKERYIGLEAKIDDIIQQANPNISRSIKIVSLDDNKTVYEENADYLLTPASNTKLVTAAAALNILGPDYCFQTDLLTDGLIQDNKLIGNLYLRGSGDPSFGEKELNILLEKLYKSGITEIQGNIYLDYSEFDDKPYADGVFFDDLGRIWNKPTSALVLDSTVIEQLDQHLENYGFNITELYCGEGKTTDSARILVSHTSQPLSQLIKPMLKLSDNLYADCIFKKLGAICYGSGTWANGTLAVKDFLYKNLGINPEDIIIEDGSGKSRYTLLSANHFTSLLTWIRHQPIWPFFVDALPKSGIDGTLQARMITAPGAILAKTGTLPGVSVLSGYVVNDTLETFAFSILLNGFIQQQIPLPIKYFNQTGQNYKATIEDQIGEYLAQLASKDVIESNPK